MDWIDLLLFVVVLLISIFVMFIIVDYKSQSTMEAACRSIGYEQHSLQSGANYCIGKNGKTEVYFECDLFRTKCEVFQIGGKQ